MTSDSTFNTAAIFWLLAGVLIGVAASVAFGKLWRQTQVSFGRARGIAISTVGAFALAVIAVLIYSALGRPDVATGTMTATPQFGPHGMAVSANTDPNENKSMESVTEKLAARLARDGGADTDWQLLAQSYDFMGRPEDAQRAREHAVAPNAGATANNSATVAVAGANASANQAILIEQTKARPKDATAWLALAESYRLQRNYKESLAAFAVAIKLKGMTADSWANYADALASSKDGATKLSGTPAQAIDKALALNPNHAKALWLKASFALEEHRYVEALAVWKNLRAVIGDNDSDAKIIDANIAEAQQLAGIPITNEPSTKAAAASTQNGEVTGTIEIDPKLLARVTPGSTLFIYAKTVGSPGPPLAVLRTTVTHWPVEFKLDDSLSMMPSRTLSSVTNAIIEARISRTGQAMPTAGDFQAPGIQVNVRDGKVVHLRIVKEVG